MTADAGRHGAGCMHCGAALVYLDEDADAECVFCGEPGRANARCEEGHWVCDRCHARDAVAFLTHACLTTDETDMVALFERLRRHPSLPVHGPEHHGLVPGVILATYRNLGGAVTDEQIRTAIERGMKVPGGFCGFVGGCGAALGAGAAFGILLGSTPVTPRRRRAVLGLTRRFLQALEAYDAARCCQRESWTVLQEAVKVSAELLPITLRADAPFTCTQMKHNRECYGSRCPVHPKHVEQDR